VSASTQYLVRVLVSGERELIVEAVTKQEAMEEAAKLSGVIHVIDAELAE
jgi:hypothetical protein